MDLLAIIALALVVSIDGFAAGAAYGIRRIKLPISAICLVSATSAVTMYISMTIGSTVRELIPEKIAGSLGAVMLIVLGVYLARYQHESPIEVKEERDILHVRIPSLGLVIRVWHDPLLADSDHSGWINPVEAIVLGLALALDAFGAGIGAAMTGLSAGSTALTVGLCKLILVSLGLRTGQGLSRIIPPKVMTSLPGLVLIFIGIGHLL